MSRRSGPGILIQARTGSSRMPNKVLEPFHDGRSMLELLVRRLRNRPGYPLVVATTREPEDDAIEEACAAWDVPVHRGETDDVLARFLDAAERFEVGTIVRVCADNPFLPWSVVEDLVLRGPAEADYVGHEAAPGLPVIRSHLGLAAETMTLEALRRAGAAAPPADREHVTKYRYEHPGTFEVVLLPLPAEVAGLGEVRLTVDTPADFEIASELYARTADSAGEPDLRSLRNLLDSRPELRDRMRAAARANPK